MVTTLRQTRIITGVDPDRIPFDELADAQQPVILKGLVGDWSLVRAGEASGDRAMTYLETFYNGQPIGCYLGGPDIVGRFFYDDSCTGLNFATERMLLGDFFGRIREHRDNERPPAFYIGATPVDAFFPGLRQQNDLAFDHPMFAERQPQMRIWLGNRTVACAHYDLSSNLACCAVGRRRFTLFPPDQVANLYPGPLEPTPGGQAVSMVDVANPDFARYPRFRDALAAAQVAELEAGDALFYPSMWWHQVEALGAFNVLINYWWDSSPDYMGTPMNVLLHALLGLRDRPEHEKAAWRALFDYYVFGPAGRAGEHLPEPSRGNLGPMDDVKARRLRAYLLNRLNR